MRSEEREAMRAEKAAERDELRKIPDAFKLNLAANPDRFYEIIQGTYRPPTLEGEDPRITKPLDTAKFVKQSRKLTGQEYDEDEGSEEVDHSISRAGVAKSAKQSTKFASVIQELERFDFSDDPKKREAQISIVAQGIRKSLQHLRLQEVASNTRKAYGKYVQRIEPTPGGIKVSFDFGTGQLAVIAQGSFYGDETVCVFAENGTAKAAVMKIANGQKGVLEGFNVTIQKIGAK